MGGRAGNRHRIRRSCASLWPAVTLRLFKCGLARGRIVGREREHAKGERAEEQGACLTADPDGFFRACDRLGPPSGKPMKFRQKCQRLRFKTPRAELLRQRQGGFGMSRRGFKIHQGVAAEERCVMTNHFRAAMPDPRRSSDRGVGDRDRASRIPGKPLGEGRHWAVRNFDAAKAILLAQLDTLAEPAVCADHASAHVLGVTEAAERHGR